MMNKNSNTNNEGRLFTPPTAEQCTLVANGALAELGCPRVARQGEPFCSCSHGLDSFVCEHHKK